MRTTESGDQSRSPDGGQAGASDRQSAMLEQQRQTIAELQTPVIQVWDRILALPIVGSLDTARTQDMNESLLQKIVDTDSEIVTRVRKSHHAGLIVASPDPVRVDHLLDDYTRRFAVDFHATAPPPARAVE